MFLSQWIKISEIDESFGTVLYLLNASKRFDLRLLLIAISLI
jgi:hypothetical protein